MSKPIAFDATAYTHLMVEAVREGRMTLDQLLAAIVPLIMREGVDLKTAYGVLDVVLDNEGFPRYKTMPISPRIRGLSESLQPPRIGR